MIKATVTKAQMVTRLVHAINEQRVSHSLMSERTGLTALELEQMVDGRFREISDERLGAAICLIGGMR